MKEFLEKALRQNVIMTENKEVYKKLPLAYRGRYDIFTVETNGALWMAIHPKDDAGLVNPLTVLESVYAVIVDRMKNPKEDSYTNAVKHSIHQSNSDILPIASLLLP